MRKVVINTRQRLRLPAATCLPFRAWQAALEQFRFDSAVNQQPSRPPPQTLTPGLARSTLQYQLYTGAGLGARCCVGGTCTCTCTPAVPRASAVLGAGSLPVRRQKAARLLAADGVAVWRSSSSLKEGRGAGAGVGGWVDGGRVGTWHPRPGAPLPAVGCGPVTQLPAAARGRR